MFDCDINIFVGVPLRILDTHRIYLAQKRALSLNYTSQLSLRLEVAHLSVYEVTWYRESRIPGLYGLLGLHIIQSTYYEKITANIFIIKI